MSLSKSLYFLLSTDSIQEKGKCPNMTENLMIGSKASIHILKKSFRVHMGKPIQVLHYNMTRK